MSSKEIIETTLFELIISCRSSVHCRLDVNKSAIKSFDNLNKTYSIRFPWHSPQAMRQLQGQLGRVYQDRLISNWIDSQQNKYTMYLEFRKVEKRISEAGQSK
jgi:hypothetical protein